NTCTGTVVDLVGLGEIQRFCESVGMTRTVHRFGIPPRLPRDHVLAHVSSTAPRDQGLLLDLMLQGAEDPAAAARLGSTPALCRLGLGILSGPKVKAPLALRLLPGRHTGH